MNTATVCISTMNFLLCIDISIVVGLVWYGSYKSVSVLVTEMATNCGSAI